MRVLIVAESCFGNTRTVAGVVAARLARKLGAEAVTLVRPGEAPQELPADVDLLIVGAPTHDYSIPGEQSRRQAAQKGATVDGGVGVREWVAQVTPRAELRVVTFDTSIKTRFSLGSAAKAAAKALKKRGFRGAERGPSFYVVGTAGPLADDAKQCAETWGADLAASLSR
jgi:hypothetical protein